MSQFFFFFLLYQERASKRTHLSSSLISQAQRMVDASAFYAAFFIPGSLTIPFTANSFPPLDGFSMTVSQ